MGYLFFLSYARKDNQTNRDDDDIGLIKEFYLDLQGVVRRKTAMPEDEIGFFDGEDIQTGSEWLKSLTRGLQTCQTLVSLYSPTYFTKEFCGREWAVFSRRQQAYAETLEAGATPPALILPVIWEGQTYVQRKMPEALKSVQFTQDAFGPNYPKYGLRRIMTDENLKNAYYQPFLEAFSDKLIEASDQHPNLPQLDGLEPLDEVAPTFPAKTTAGLKKLAVESSTANPRYVKFTFVAGRQSEFLAAKVRQRLECYGQSGAEWLPFLPDLNRDVDLLVKDISIDGNFSPEGTIAFNKDFVTNVEEAGRNNQIVVVVIDTWTLKLPAYQQLLQPFDGKSFLHCIIVVPWNQSDEETVNNRVQLEKYLGITLPTIYNNKPQNFLGEISSADELRRELTARLNETKKNIIRQADILREIQGGQIVSKPIVVGPSKN